MEGFDARNEQKRELAYLTIIATMNGSVTLVQDESGYRYSDTYVRGELVLRTQRGKSPAHGAFKY